MKTTSSLLVVVLVELVSIVSVRPFQQANNLQSRMIANAIRIMSTWW